MVNDNKLSNLNCSSIIMNGLVDNKSRFFYETLGAKLLKSEKVSIAGTE